MKDKFNKKTDEIKNDLCNNGVQHVFIVGAKSIGQYGGYETFVDKLTEYHQNIGSIKYHISSKANGDGSMDESKLDNISNIIKKEDNVVGFTYHNADVFKVAVPNIGPAVAIYYDVVSLNKCIGYCIKNNINNPVFYILACRIGPFIYWLKRKIHRIGGQLYINPDGHEWKRKKWPLPIRKYWKLSERLMVKNADLIICDSVNIEKYIKEEYKNYKPNTIYISYGSDIKHSKLSNDDPRFIKWLNTHDISINNYYLVVGRFVPENNYETIIREFMSSTTNKDLVLITNTNQKLFTKLSDKLSFEKDSRIKFVGTVYDQELLKKIRENAFAYIHGHEVGGTNPSLLEALGSTKLNLLFDVSFNKEVAEDSALYWNKTEGSLSKLLENADKLDSDTIKQYDSKSKERIIHYYNWNLICDRYYQVFLNGKD